MYFAQPSMAGGTAARVPRRLQWADTFGVAHPTSTNGSIGRHWSGVVVVHRSADPAPRLISRGRYAAVSERNASTGLSGQRLELASDGLPLAIDAAAMHGLAGEVIRTLQPSTEADPAGLLLDLLTSFGNVVGAGPHCMVDGARHEARLNVVLAGDTARSRKGTARRQINQLMERAFPDWTRRCVIGGLSTGEGLIAAFRVDDDGVAQEPRLLVAEDEYGRLIVVANRDGATLSHVVRQAWDSGTLNVLTRKDPLRLRGAHISIIGHITLLELELRLREVDMANGFANRHLWIMVRRSQRVPARQGLTEPRSKRLASLIATAARNALAIRRVERSAGAEVLWEKIYYALDDHLPGKLSGVLARIEAQLVRLSLIYALIDCSDVIQTEHVWAACAVLDYSVASAAFLFGNETGNRVADRLLRGLLTVYPSGLDGTDQRKLFSNHISATELGGARSRLEKLGLITTVEEKSGGRSRNVAYATSHIAQNALKVPGVLGGNGLIAHLELFAQQTQHTS